ncbi:MAG TPA: hypothetical protein VIK06_06485 [Candidatus Limnocylindrales bacterium]|jgi:photosystem II stability/assembly factor-like uncharacterized protein
MADERDLDAEIRAALEAMAPRPAPDRLLDRVVAIPTAEPNSGALRQSSPSRPRLGFGLATAAIAAIVIAGALYFRGGIQNGASETTPPASASSFAAETPTQTPSQTSSEGTLTPAPSVVAVVPSLSPSPSPSPTSPDAIPADFEPLSVTFVSADMGWVLGMDLGCASDPCPAIVVRTLDGGRTWTRIAAPPTSHSTTGLQAGNGVSNLRFADALDGWAFGPGLWATHDGGKTWKQLTIPGLPGAAVAALEASAGAVQVVAYDGNTTFRIASSPVSSDAWLLSALKVPVGAGPVPEVQLVLQGQAGWLLENDRVVTGGARLVDGTWQAWQPPCFDVTGPALLAAANAQAVTAVCDVGQWSTPQGEHLYRSTDGGQTFAETGPKLPVEGISAIAAPTTSTIVVAATGPSTNAIEVIASRDGGLTWASVLIPGPVQVAYLGFTTATQGVLITSDPGSRTQLLMTRDGGHTWTPVQF